MCCVQRVQWKVLHMCSEEVLEDTPHSGPLRSARCPAMRRCSRCHTERRPIVGCQGPVSRLGKGELSIVENVSVEWHGVLVDAPG